MFDSSSLQLAQAMAQGFEKRGLKVVPAGNTPLAALVGCMDYQECLSLEGLDATEDIFSATQSVAMPGDEVCLYDRTMDDVAKVMSEKVKDHLNMLRTVVNPYVTDLRLAVEKDIAQMTPSALLKTDVTVVGLPSLLSDSGFLSMVSRYRANGIDTGQFPAKPVMPEMTEQELRALLNTGVVDLDQAVADYLARCPADFLSEVYRQCFRIKSETMGRVFTRRDGGRDYAIVALLLADRFIQNVVDGAVGSLSEYNTGLSVIRDQAALHLTLLLEKQESDVKNQALILSVNKGVTTVNQKVYEAWMESGGDVDVLMGNSLRAKPYLHVHELDQHRDELLALWRKHCSLVENNESLHKLNYVKNSLRSQFAALLGVELANQSISAQQQTEVMNLFLRELDFVNLRDLDDLHHTCIRLVCRSRFSGLDADLTLGNIHRIAEENESMDVREAALVATTNYVIQWVASQMKVELA